MDETVSRVKVLPKFCINHGAGVVCSPTPPPVCLPPLELQCVPGKCSCVGASTPPPPLICQPGEIAECNIGGVPDACQCMPTRRTSCTVEVQYHPTDPSQVFVSYPEGPGCAEGLAMALTMLAARLMSSPGP